MFRYEFAFLGTFWQTGICSLCVCGHGNFEVKESQHACIPFEGGVGVVWNTYIQRMLAKPVA